MTIPPYNPGTPQPTDIPADSQTDFLGNFLGINSYYGVDHVPFGNIIESATSANPCRIVSTNHGLTTGNTVFVFAMKGVLLGVQKDWSINTNSYTATVVDANTFTLNVDTTVQPAYIANSGCFSCSALPYGYHKQISLLAPLAADPMLTPPASSFYSKFLNSKDTMAQLFFQNGTSSNLVKALAGQTIVQTNTGRGIKTPWGLIINFGQVPFIPIFPTGPNTYSFPIPYSTSALSLIVTPFFVPRPSEGPASFQGNIISTAQFTITTVGRIGPLPFYYFSIGF